jgi:O-antigen ligase/tetratricopeptide (TPR) repeat protein
MVNKMSGPQARIASRLQSVAPHQPMRRDASARPTVLPLAWDATAFGACLAAACVIPALFDPRAERVFDEPKAIVLWSLAAVAAAALLVCTTQRSCRLSDVVAPRDARALLVAVGMLIVAYLAASVSSLAPRIAWEGAYVRRFGAAVPASGIAFLLTLLVAARTPRAIRQVIDALLLASVVPVAYAICQRAGLDVATWIYAATDRVTSTAGNPIFLAGYVAMIWPLALARFATAGRSPAATAGAVLFTGLTAAMVITGSAGAWLGLVAAVVTLVSVLLDRVPRQLRAFVIALLVAGAIGALGVAVARRPFLDSARNSESRGTQSGRVRLVLWHSAMRLLRENPVRAIWGYGPDTTRWTLGTYDPMAVRPFEGSATADRAHNAVLDTVLTIGFVGLIARTAVFLVVCVAALRRLGAIATRSDLAHLAAWTAGGWLVFGWLAVHVDPAGGLLPLAWSAGLLAGVVGFAGARGVRSRDARPWRGIDLLCAALLAGVVAHEVDTQTGIETATTELCFWMFSGLIIVLPQCDEPSLPTVPDSTKLRTALMAGLALAVVTFDFGTKIFEPGVPLLLFAVLAAAALAIGAALCWSDRAGRRRFLPWAVGVWGTFVAVSWLSTAVLRSAIDVGDPSLTPLTMHALGQVVGLAATITVAIAAVAWSGRQRQVSARISAVPFSGRVATVLILAALAAVVVRNVIVLYADELSGIGATLTEMEQWPAALRIHQRSLALASYNDVYAARVGDAQFEAFHRIGDRTRLDVAIDAYRAAHQIAPYEASYLRQLAFLESVAADAAPQRADDYLRSAAGHLADAAALVPRDPEVWNARAKIALREQQASVAVVSLERSLALNERAAETHLMYGEALLATGDASRALSEYEAADRLGIVDRLPAISGRALALVRLGRIDEAIEANRAALAVAPDDFTTRKNLALLYEQMGNVTAAATYAAAAAEVADAEARPELEALARSLHQRIRATDPRSR